MNCKNCGAKINDETKICPDCGAYCREEEGYVLLSQNDIMDDFYTDDVKSESKKKRSTVIIVIFIVLAIIAAGAFYYLNYIKNNADKPELSFTSGSGMINDDEEVIYVQIPNNSKIEFIHGVSLYDYDKNEKNHSNEKAITKDYQYTKSIDDSFRTIFFDVDDFNLKKDKQYSYTFEMNFSFYGSEAIYTYEQTVEFKGEITNDASDIVFDHSLDKAIEESTTNYTAVDDTTKDETTANSMNTSNVNVDYIYDGYWFTQPYNDADTYTIYSIKFNKNNTFTTTEFYKKGTSDWKLSTVAGNFEIKDGVLIAQVSTENEKATYKIDSKNGTIQEVDGNEVVQNLTNRKYNSIKNAEDFFGL